MSLDRQARGEMKIMQLDGVPCCARDAEILQAVQAQPSTEGQGLSLRIGLRNEAGVVYRVLVAESEPEFEHISDALYDMGWVDEREGQSAPAGDEYHALFRCPSA